MFYEKLAEAKAENERGRRNRLDDVGFNVGAGVLAHQGLKRGLDASAFSRLNESGRGAVSARSSYHNKSPREVLKGLSSEELGDITGTRTHNPLTKIVDKLSGAEDLRDTYKKHRANVKDLQKQYEGAPFSGASHLHDAEEVAERALDKLRGRRLLGRRVAHGVGLAGALYGANKLRNMYNARKQREE
jgi:hypothetical protein